MNFKTDILSGWYDIALRSEQRPKNQKGKTAHTDPQFKHSLKKIQQQPGDKLKG